MPIPGWDDEEVNRWLRANRGTPHDCVDSLLPNLSPEDRKRGIDRCRYLVRKLKAEGLDFSKPRPPNLVSLPRPKHQARTLPAPEPRPTVGGSGAPPLPPAPEPTVRLSEMSKSQQLAWTIDRAAQAVLMHDGRGSIASTLKYLNEAHAELKALEAKQGVEGLSMERIREIWPGLLKRLPADLLEQAVKEHLAQNPKQMIGPKRRAVG